MDIELTKNADTLICAIYKDYLQKVKAGISLSRAKTFAGAEYIKNTLGSKLARDDISEILGELGRAGLLHNNYADDEPYTSIISDKAIIYMEGRFKRGLDEVLEYVSKVRSVLFP